MSTYRDRHLYTFTGDMEEFRTFLPQNAAHAPVGYVYERSAAPIGMHRRYRRFTLEGPVEPPGYRTGKVHPEPKQGSVAWERVWRRLNPAYGKRGFV